MLELTGRHFMGGRRLVPGLVEFVGRREILLRANLD